MKTFFTAFSFLFIISQLNFINAQNQLGEKWVARYNGSPNAMDVSISIAVDGAGNVYVTGSSSSVNNNDYLTIKYNPSGVQQWLTRYNGPANLIDDAYSIAVDATGNVYVTGASEVSLGNPDCTTIKYNSLGVQQWLQRYNGTGNSIDVGIGVRVDASGGIYVAGASVGSGGNHDFITIKYNTTGTVSWIQRYNGTGNGDDDVTDISVDGSGSVYVTGQSFGSNNSYDYATIKYNTSGVQQWVQRYNGSANGFDGAKAIAVDVSGNVYVTGSSYTTSYGYDYITIKYSSSGVQQWIGIASYNYDDIANDIAVGSDGSVYVTGVGPVVSGHSDIWTVKFNSSGNGLWGTRYNGPGNSNDVGNSVSLDNIGNLYVSGSSVGIGTGLDYILLRYSTTGGNPLTEKRYNGPGNGTDVSFENAVDANGCIYLTGESYSGPPGNRDYCTIKYMPLPPVPVLVYPPNNTPGISCTPLLNWNDVAIAESYTVQVSTSNTFNSFVLNQSGLTASQYQVTSGALQFNVQYYWRVCGVNIAGTGPWSNVWGFRTALVGIQPISSEIPEVYELYSNSPNPFNPTTEIRFDIPKSGLVTLKVIDIFGKEIETIVNKRLEPGKYKSVFNGSNLSSGVYFYQLKTDEYISTNKMVLVK